MIKWNLHAHTVTSDGKITAEEIVRRASAEGLEGLAITDHFPYPCYPIAWDEVDWASSRVALEKQRKDLEGLSGRYPGLTVLAGAEVEFVDGLDLLAKWLRGLDLDFVLGGVHLLDRWALDWSEEDFLRGRGIFGSLQGAFARYFQAVGELADSGLVDSIAHLDVVKKYNAGERHFSEGSEWYRELVRNGLHAIATANVAMEVSTAGLRRPVGAIYPSEWILREARDLGIQVTVGTDYHLSGESVAADLDRAEATLRATGYESYLVFQKRRPRSVGLS
jgi:histidinol-phosphatase (PHP family)